MSLRTRIVQDLANRWPLDQISASRVRRRIWISLLQTLKPAEQIDVSYFGMRLRVDPRERLTLARQVMMRCAYEPLETDVFQRLVRRGMSIVDVGANFGHYTLLAAQLVGSEGQVLAVEPSPAALRDLRENISLNSLENIAVEPSALGARSGAAWLFHDARRGGHHSLAAANVRDPGAELLVTVRTLDDLRREARRPFDLIKLDTQGSEAAILAGARETLERDRPLLIAEFWPYGIRHVGQEPEVFLEALHAAQYRLLRMGDRSLTETSPGELQCRLLPERRHDDVNLLCIPRERWDEATAGLAAHLCSAAA